MYKITTKKGDAKSKAVLVAATSMLLVACGGDSGDSDSGGVTSPSFTVNATAALGGSISPASRNVQSGKTTTFTVTTDTGYSIGNITGCNGSLSGNTYTTGAITAACSVQTSFVVTLGAPENLQVTAGNSELSFSWDSVAGATSYNLYYDTQPNIDQVNYAANNTGEMLESVTSPYSLTGLTNGMTYYAVVTAKAGSAESLASNEINSTPQLTTLTSIKLNDTGIDWCANNDSNNLACPVADFEGQDGEYGRDVQVKAGQLQKVGGGAAGFDFTKIAANGSVLAIQDASWDNNGSEMDGSRWSCVRDNVTGLIWEVKTTDSGLRNMNYTFTWYNPDNTTNGGSAGKQNDGATCFSNCDTYAYVQVINSEGLCGARDWRMPSRSELLSIVHNGRSNPAIDTDYFPNAFFGYFWTYSPSDSYSAWVVNLSTGGIGNLAKDDRFNGYIRLVRKGQ